MKNMITQFAKLARSRPEELMKLKSEGVKIVEYIGNFIPVEMIYAAGAEAYPMWRGGEPEAPDALLEESLRFMNPFARSIAGCYYIGVDPVTPIADLIAASLPECHIQRITELLELKGLPIQKVGIPVDWETEADGEYYFGKLMALKERLEKLTGNTITDSALRQQVAKSNKIYSLLRKISDLRKRPNPPLSGMDFIKINHYVAMTNPDVALDMLGKIYESLKNAEGRCAPDAPRILIEGHVIAIGDYIVVKALEDAGCVIVKEMLDEGFVWYENDVSEQGDPMRAIWRAKYLDKCPINIFQPAWRRRFDHMKKMFSDCNADAVIWYQLLYDEIYDMEYTCLAKWLSEAKIPLLNIQTSYEYTREAMLPLETKIESFVASLKQKRSMAV